ncbi:hypothetical protein LEP1GSC172_1005 [Leptospira noguchii]|uniref:Uncharacterized protein n=1 Tax=Leptospira noguchii TaxID=28182 RepID=M6VC26_9LEPT|nr:hypothetical protein LEP1GSC172_1005 [Leptospira noguchii]
MTSVALNSAKRFSIITLPTVEENFRIRKSKNAHFSSVPTRMSLFTCKKYVFLIEKSLHPKLGETHATLSQTQCLTPNESFDRSR